MSDYAVMPYADYQDACDAVREKTGGTEVIKSGDMGAQIRAITGGENLDDVLETQDDLIAQIMAAFVKCKITIAPGPVSGPNELASVEIDGTIYNAITNTGSGEGAVVVKVDPGTNIVFRVSGSDAEASPMCWISINEECILDGDGSYIHTVTEDVEIILGVQPYSTDNYYGTVYATTSGTEPESDFTPTDSGGTTYKSKFADNNVDLQAILDKVNSL